jgi:CheY-like chemotaxis protein
VAGGEEAIPTGSAAETILVVEDEPRVREMSVEALRELGYGVVAAEGGAEALDLLERHPEISLVFTDVVMPGISGRQLADAVAERRPDLPVLFTTGYAREQVAPGREEAALLRKPFTTAQLARKMREALDAAGRRAAAGDGAN